MFPRSVPLALVLAAAFAPARTQAQPPAPPAFPPINPAAARPDQTVGGLDGPGFAVAASPSGNLLAAACEGGTVQYWKRDVMTGVRVPERTSQVLNGHQGPVTALAWCEGGRLATAGADKKIFLWQMPEGKLLHTLSAGAVVRALAASPDGKTLASAEGSAVQLWDVAQGKPRLKLEDHPDWVLSLAFSPDGARLATGCYDGNLRVWEVVSGKKVLEVAGRAPPPANQPVPPPNVLSALAFSPDGAQIAVGGSDARIHLFNAADGKLVRSLNGHTSAVSALAYHPGGKVLVSGSKDRTVRLWNPANGQMLKNLEGHASWVQGVTLLEKGTRLASVSADQTLRLWDLTPQ